MSPTSGSNRAYIATLHERSAALRNYITELAAENSGSDLIVGEAFQAFITCTNLIDSQAEANAKDETDAPAVLAPLLAHLRRVETIADRLFSRGHALAVPKALRVMTKKELIRLGLTDHKAVLVLGPPQNFETYVGDLRSTLFDKLLFDLVEVPKSSDVLAVVSLPYLEGTRALWQPLTMGHELAHLAEKASGTAKSVQTDQWLDRDLLGKLDSDSFPLWFQPALDPL